MPRVTQKLVAVLVAVAAMVTFPSVFRVLSFRTRHFLPDSPSYSTDATITTDDDSVADVSFVYPNEGMIRFSIHKYGVITLTVVDGDKIVQYSFEGYNDNGFRKQGLIISRCKSL